MTSAVKLTLKADDNIQPHECKQRGYRNLYFKMSVCGGLEQVLFQRHLEQ